MITIQGVDRTDGFVINYKKDGKAGVCNLASGAVSLCANKDALVTALVNEKSDLTDYIRKTTDDTGDHISIGRFRS